MKTDLIALRSRLGLATRSLVNQLKIKLKDLSEAREHRAAVLAGPTVAERRAELIDFYDHFENFVETLCDAAQYGNAPRLAEAYGRERAWLVARYQGLRPLLLGYLRHVEAEGPDAVTGLLAQETLGAFLQADDGLMISRITLGREALSLYGEHLRQLAA
jgi:hypothetical protein